MIAAEAAYEGATTMAQERRFIEMDYASVAAPPEGIGAKSVAGNVADAILMGVWWLERNPR